MERRLKRKREGRRRDETKGLCSLVWEEGAAEPWAERKPGGVRAQRHAVHGGGEL